MRLIHPLCISLRTTISAATFQMGLLTVAMMSAAYVKLSLNPVQEAIRADLGISDTQIAILQGAALAVPAVVLSVPFGLLVDHCSRKALVIVLLFILLLGSLLTAASTSFLLVMAARGLVGAAVFAMVPVIFSMTADLFPPAARGRAAMVLAIGQYCAVSAVFGVAAMLISMYPGSWRPVLLWLVVPPLTAILFATFLMREPTRHEQLVHNATYRTSFREFWMCRSVIVPLFAGGTLSAIGLGAVMIWAAPTLQRNYGLSAIEVADSMAVLLPVGGIAGTIIGGIAADRCQLKGGPSRTVGVLAAMALLGGGSGFFSLMPSVDSARYLLCAGIMALTAAAIMTSTVSANVVPNEIRGLFSATMAGLEAIVAVALAPLAVSTVAAKISGPASLSVALTLICVPSGVLAAIVFIAARPRFRRAVSDGQ